MQKQGRDWRPLAWTLAVLLIGIGLGDGRARTNEPPFQYAGGTASIGQGCAGKLEVTTDALKFHCPRGSIDMPFSAITRMEYRPDLSPRVRKLRIEWKAVPRPGRGKENRYFTVVYTERALPQVIVLKVAPLSMRPYLAEIELKSGKRVEVMGYEEYQ